MLNDAAKQALVFTHDSDAPDSKRECYVGTDNVAAGRQAGDLIKEALPQGGRIAIFVGKLDARNAQERLQGIKEAIAGSRSRSSTCAPTTPIRFGPRRTSSEMLVSHPDVAALVGLWSYNGPAILNAVRDAGKIGQVKIVAFDEDDETLTGVKSGAIVGTVVQQPYRVRLPVDHAAGEGAHGRSLRHSGGPPAVHPDEGDSSEQRGRVQDDADAAARPVTPRAPLLQLRAIDKRFPGVHALRGVSLEVHAGEVVALLGENGAGKSTLMKIVGGIEQPDAGEMLIDGAPVAIRGRRRRDGTRDRVHPPGAQPARQSRRRRQRPARARTDPLGRAAARSIARSMRDDRAAATSISSASTCRPDTPIAALSIAQQQLVEIAKALSLNARLIIMDEPTSSLTLTEAGRLHEVVASLRERGVGDHLHHPPARRSADHRRSGRRAARRRQRRRRSAREALTHDNMIALMVGRDIDVDRDRRTGAANGSEYFRGRRAPHPALSRSTRFRSASAAARYSGWPAWSAPAGRRWRWRFSASSRRSPASVSLAGTAAPDHVPAGRDRPRDLSRAGGPPGRRGWSWTSRSARTCRCRRSADTRATACLRERRSAAP